eukprot:Protomagalhaensia_sp_Gyna_25__5885@NODE_88_length_5373_cov_34_085677_g68_i0_p1_GENE_NODE_88_length_5373_cov_34_085677_g68_i0NODE_88_length_5373_cov_34_085677_g68_i0_p1_ORF_typecomplete_len816_score189_05HAUS5/PF14817_6/15HAUS5/PF14817_6/2_2e03HAUS5/PF14817_6/99PCI/PF01399_27/0_014PCI/PF01399_27/4_2e03TERT_thumb/PF17984_1/0_14AAA_15/PF13175_6/0_14E3_UbLigase_R4/PF13764_6/0_72DUF4486/PF14858_6/0_15DUF4486/PF14858_6/4_1e03DUF5635/PF18685_1/1_8e02DUF5635/PF18685_1/2_4e02DUF5635/PF18685_1/18AbiH/PF14
MSQFLAPPSALLRAAELTSVGQDSEAFETLHRTITDRRFRYVQWEASQQEEVVAQYVALAIKLERTKAAREGLLQYRNHCQHTMAQPGALDRVLRKFRTHAEEALKEAMAAKEADAGAALEAAAVFDAEGGQGVDAVELLHQAVVGEDCWSAATRKYQACAKLTLEVYRTIMDIIKTTPKLQKLYHETAHRAFEFCRDHQRPNDFRRLCEMVRNHYVSIMKPQKTRPDADPQSKLDYEELRLPELHIETRLSQLKNAAALELWKEAMQTMEDLYSLGIIELASKRLVMKSKAPGAVQLRQLLLMSLAAYYEKLAEVFGRSGFANLHAFALLTWLQHTKTHNKALTEEEHRVWASVAVLAVLAVPVRGDVKAGARYDEEKKLALLLGHPTVPTRTVLIAMLRDRGILETSFPCVRQFFQTVEGAEFLPFTVVGIVLPLFEEIRNKLTEADQHVTEKTATVIFTAGTFHHRGEEYIARLKEVVFRKLVVKLGGVYSIMNIDFFRTKVCPPSFMSWSAAERSLVSLAEECGLALRLDYVNGVIRLAEAEDLVARNDTVTQRLSALSAELLRVLSKLDSAGASQTLEAQRKDLISRLVPEQEQASMRLTILKQRRNELDDIQKRRAENMQEMQKEKEKRELQVEREKQRQLQEEKALQKKKAETELARLECAAQLLTKMRALCVQVGASTHQFQVSGIDLASLTPESLVGQRLTFRDFESALYEYQAKAKQEQLKLKRQEQKRLDHYCRALRIEEAKTVDAWAERIKEQDARVITEYNQKLHDEREAKIQHIRARHQLLVDATPLIQKYLNALQEDSSK